MRIGIGIGGTFTDAIAVVDGETFIVKIPSSYPAPSAVTSAVQAALTKASKSSGEVSALIHGSTVATNAVIERDLDVFGLITTAEFRDVLAIGRQTRNTAVAPGYRFRALSKVSGISIRRIP
jgi:N-methylhydantoinase A